MSAFLTDIKATLAEIEADGLFKRERAISTPQSAHITAEGRPMLNLCANNYLGLADHPALIAAAHQAMQEHGYGMASVRFICGTADLHRELESALAQFLNMDDAILFAACFDANGGLFEPLLGPDDAIISDALNHASIIDGIRLCKAKRYRYATSDMDDLETQLKAARADGARRGALSGGGVRHMLLQDLLLGDLGCASEWASVGRPAGAHRDAGPAARNASTQRSRRHSCRLSSSVTVRGTCPMLGGVLMLAYMQPRPRGDSAPRRAAARRGDRSATAAAGAA